jgi:hypothetical protein
MWLSPPVSSSFNILNLQVSLTYGSLISYLISKSYSDVEPTRDLWTLRLSTGHFDLYTSVEEGLGGLAGCRADRMPH